MSDSEDESRDKTLKVVIIGDGSSGKVTKFSFSRTIFLLNNYVHTFF